MSLFRSSTFSRLTSGRAVALLAVALTPALSWSQVTPNVIIQWNNALLQGVRDSKIGPPMVARALAIAHTCMFDAWASYDSKAIGTTWSVTGNLRRPAIEDNDINRNKAISYAAYRAAIDLFPADQASVFDPLMTSLGYSTSDNSQDVTTPSGIGNVVGETATSLRHNDGSNQLGTQGTCGKPYCDYTNFVALNPATTVPVNKGTVANINAWQPLQYFDATNVFITQSFLGAQWTNVTPFALTSSGQYRSYLAANYPVVTYGSQAFLDQSAALITLSAQLNDQRKMIAEYWKDGPHSETPPGHWCLHAQYISARDNHTLTQDVKMFFALTNAVFDAGIAAWDAKVNWDSVRPITAIPYIYTGTAIQTWGGPYKGTVVEDGGLWTPYQPSTFPTPPFPEFMSGHSTFSAAAGEVLRRFSGSSNFGKSVTFAAGSSSIEPGAVPALPVTLTWPTFKYASDQAGISRRYGGIHFQVADMAGRDVGKQIGDQAFTMAESYWKGTVTGAAK